MTAKLTAVLLLVACLQVAAGASGQITLKAKEAELTSVFKEIERQTGFEYDFFYPVAILGKARAVTVDVRNVTLDEALKAVFKGQPFEYFFKGKTICLEVKDGGAGIVDPKPNAITPITIKGKVTDINGKPLPGVTVRVKGSNTGTVTDPNGVYTLEGEPTGVIVFSFIGHQTLEIKVNNQSTIDIIMLGKQAQLNETVVKGYYNTTKELNTGNVSTVKADEIARQPVGDPMAALISKVPGLNIQQTSGVTGRRFTIRLRGQNSIDNGNDPLFIVDGVQYNSTPLNTNNSTFTAGGLASPFNYLNPADIESIEVLKDADATAIYGSRGANGVILITTKKAKDGSLQLDARFYSGFSEAPLRLKFMNTSEYLAMRNEAFSNDKKKPGAADYDLNGTWDSTSYTDWQKYFIGGTATTHDANLGLTMGNTTTAFRIAANYRSEGTIYPGKFHSNRAGLTFNANHSTINKKLTFSFSTSYNYSQNDLPVSNVEQYVTLAPVAPPPFNSDGTLNWANSTWSNPMAPFKRSALEKAKNLISNLSASYSITKKIIFKTSFGYTFTNFKQRNLTPSSSYDPAFTTIPASSKRVHSAISNDISTFVIEPQLSFNQNVYEGELDLLIGSTFQDTKGDFLGYGASGFASDAIIQNLQAATAYTGFTRNSTEYKYSALFTRIGYTYQRKYVLNLTARRDVSSRFGPGKKAGNFGAIGAAWIFSNENFLKSSTKILSFGKLRLSLGTTGNDQLGEYKYLDTYSIYNLSYQGNTSFTPTQLTNRFYGWERVNKLEIGLEIGLLHEKINLISSVYRNRTNNQLVLVPLPSTTGFSSVRANLPATIQNSGLEFEIRSTNIEQKGFSWRSSINLTIPKNKLISFPGIESSSYATKFVVGQPINQLIFLYQYTGINPNSGRFTYKDINGDGGLTTARDYLPIFVGQKFYGALDNNLTIGPVEVDFQLQFVKQNGYGYLYTGGAGSFSATRGNQLASISSMEHQPFTQSNIQAIINASLFNNSSGMITDASFIRLKNAGISYSPPIPRTTIKHIKLYILAQNLLTISNYKGFDPESPSPGIVIPPLRTLVAGIQLTL